MTTETNGADIVPQTTIDPTQNSRARCLANAAGAVLKQRNKNYGDPEDNFRVIADLWCAYKGVPFTRADVAAMTGLIKVARLKQTPTHEDSWTDLAGYAACGLAAAEADARDVEELMQTTCPVEDAKNSTTQPLPDACVVVPSDDDLKRISSGEIG